ncbi:hypothetical protein [uncultured Psychroserpens sp.]|uniref:hypothetical protein n=1 Tax=uncultured Psychroserpens sp. TaxID=255436 RepID=UPI0026139B3B|nr:hypothetical protein [uncultured Psychroserpens sp.]
MRLQIKKYDKIILFFFVAFISASSLIWLFEERFDQSKWITNPTQRYKMANDIVESKLLIGKTKDEVISLLGEPEMTLEAGGDTLLYKLGNAPSFFKSEQDRLVVLLYNNVVAQVVLTPFKE